MNEVIGRGRTADVVRYDERSVLKLFGSGMDETVVRREYECALFAWTRKAATPKPVSIISRDGRVGIVYDLAQGESLLSLISKNPLSLRSVAKEMAALHSSLHRISGSPELQKQKSAMAQAIENAPILTAAQKKDIIEYACSLPEGDRLCHGDFHPDNIIKGETAVIIDWMTGCSGNPLCDAARTVLLLESSEIPGPMSPVQRAFLRIGQKTLARAYLRSYCAISGCDARDIGRWFLPLYAARLIENLSEGETRIVLDRIRKEARLRISAS